MCFYKMLFHGGILNGSFLIDKGEVVSMKVRLPE
jgi:hypothetical protein